MQERYLGDVHDYVNWSLLTCLHEGLGAKIGVNWYKTCPVVQGEADNNHGNNRGYRNQPLWRDWQPEEFAKLDPLQVLTHRTFENFERNKVLPNNTVFCSDAVPIGQERDKWHRRVLDKLRDAEIVFLDPDNGFHVRSANAGTLRKYALYEEARDFFRQGKIVVCIQFAPKVDRIEKAKVVWANLLQGIGRLSAVPVLRARVAPNTLFFTLCQDHKAIEISKSLRSFAKGSPMFHGKDRRIDMIEPKDYAGI